MLSLVITPTDGGTPWRHLLAEGEARAGWAVVGPLGLARSLGKMLGDDAEPAPAPERVAALDSRLEADDDGERSWSTARADDPLGVAAFVLVLRDRLRAAGWDRAPLDASRRLADLSRVEALVGPGVPALPPGLADVEHALAARIRSGGLPEPLEVALSAPREAYSRSLLIVVDALRGAGAPVREAALDEPSAPAGSDLARLQSALADPGAPPAPEGERMGLAGDGSVLALEADTP
ncbi:MAG TPA: hypothetical protein VIW03_17170, partial [Anaeromyxobacter sp.]